MGKSGISKNVKKLEKPSKILEDLEQVKKDIRACGRTHEEAVDRSLEILADMKSSFKKDLFTLLLWTKEAEIENTESEALLTSLIDTITKNLNIILIFTLSEIMHRKLHKTQFKLANPFLCKESKKKFKNLKYELEDLDDEVSAKIEESPNHNFLERYQDLIRGTRILNDELADEKSSGFISYLSRLLPWGVTTVLAFYLFAIEYLQVGMGIIVLGFLIICIYVSLLLLIWNHISYGLRYIIMTKVRLASFSFLVAFSLLLIYFIATMPTQYPPFSDVTGIAFSISIIIIPIYISSQVFLGIKEENEMRRIVKKFFGEYGSWKWKIDEISDLTPLLALLHDLGHVPNTERLSILGKYYPRTFVEKKRKN